MRPSASFDLSDIDLSPETHALLPIAAGPLALEQQRTFGTWWIAPFAHIDGQDLIGLRAIPARKLSECPVVLASGPATVTISSTSRQAVPVLVFSRMFSSPRAWRDAAEFLDSEWDELIGAHRCLGGDDNLAALREIALDEQLRARCQQAGRDGRIATAEVLEILDPSPARALLRHQLSDQSHADAQLASVSEAWSAAVFALGLADTDPLPGRLRAAWGIFQSPAGLDVCWAPPTDTWPEPVATEAGKRLHAAARLLTVNHAVVPSEWRSDPLWTAIEQLAVADDVFSFSGIPFIEAAAALDELGDASRALNAATAVQFWSFLADGPQMIGALEAAHHLAKRERWSSLEAITGSVLADTADT